MNPLSPTFTACKEWYCFFKVLFQGGDAGVGGALAFCVVESLVQYGSRVDGSFWLAECGGRCVLHELTGVFAGVDAFFEPASDADSIPTGADEVGVIALRLYRVGLWVVGCSDVLSRWASWPAGNGVQLGATFPDNHS